MNQSLARPILIMDCRLRMFGDAQRPLFPIVDIAEAIGTSRDALHKIIKRNEDVFTGEFVYILSTNPKGTKGGRPDLLCVTGPGMMGLLTTIAVRYIKDAEKRARIVAFKRAANQVLWDIASGKRVAVDRAWLGDILQAWGHDRARLVREAAGESNRSPGTIYRYLRHPHTQLTGYPPPRQGRADRGFFRSFPMDMLPNLMCHISSNHIATMAELFRTSPLAGKVSYSTFRRFARSIPRQAIN